ncbi:MAG: alkaline phosphatase family protein [Terriglobia bacterium]
MLTKSILAQTVQRGKSRRYVLISLIAPPFSPPLTDLEVGATRKSGRRQARRLLLTALALAALVLTAPPNTPAQDSSNRPRERQVLVVSVDGMGASLYQLLAAKVHIPNLARLRQEGSYAEGVLGVYPTVTYPSHTTIVTGRMPAEHGIYSNLSSREAGKNPGDWFWFAKAIKTPTLWDEANAHRLSSGAVFWPATAGAPIYWDIPEIWDPQKPLQVDPVYVAKYATPGLLFEALLEIGPPKAGQELDVTRARLATFILKKYKPDLLLVHLCDLDGVEHQFGPNSSQAAATLEKIDGHIGELLAADEAAGLADSTDVFIVSDHGFLPVGAEIQPNVLLVKAGLLTADEKGNLTGGRIATLANGGSFFIYWPQSQDLRSEVSEALKPLRKSGALWGVLDRAALKDLGAEPAAQMALEASTGYEFGSGAAGDVISSGRKITGTHGYLPFRRELESSFIAWGPDIKAGVDLHTIRMTEIAPTILKAMGIDDPKFGEEPPLLEIFK